MRGSNRGRFNSLGFRISFFNVLGFFLTFLVVFLAMNRIQWAFLIAETDRSLETEILVITSALDATGEINAQTLAAELSRFSLAHGIGRSFFRALTEDGREIAGSDLAYWPEIRKHPLPLPEILEKPFVWATIPLREHGVRVIYYRYPNGLILQIGYDLEETAALQQHYRTISAAGLSAILVLGSVIGWIVTQRALRGIREIGDAAESIRERGNLATRVPWPTGSGDTDRLAETFNQMLEKIDALVRNLRYVMDNIAHDIKTPVTRMRGLAESRLQDQPEEDTLAGHVVEECDHILNLVNALLEITAAESGLVQWRIQTVDLVSLVREGCELFSPLFENRDLTLVLELPEVLTVETDGRALQRVVSNLIDNAVKYTPPGGRIRVCLDRVEDMARLQIQDNGIGIEEHELSLIFNRFHRSDRSRSTRGNGLGLSYCKAAVEALGGSIACRSKPNLGATFTVLLPRSHGIGGDARTTLPF